MDVVRREPDRTCEPAQAPGRRASRDPSMLGLLLLFLLLAAVLRAPTFSDRVFNADEAYLATQAQVLNSGGRLYVDTVDRKPPVVPYVYAAVFRVTGSDSLAPVRLLAMLAQVLTAALLAAEARRRLRWRHAAVCAGVGYLLAATAFHPTDALAANFEVFMIPVMTAALLLGIRDRPVAAGATLGLATLTKQTAATALLPLAYLAWRARRWRGLLELGLAFVALLVGAAILFGPHDFFFWVFSGNRGYLDVGGAFGYALELGARQTGWFLLGSAALLVLLPCAWKHRREDRDLWLWLASGVVAVAIGFRFFPHYYLQLVPPLTLLAVRGLDSISLKVRTRWLVAVALLAVATTAFFLVPAFTSGETRDTTIALDVARYVEHHTAPGQRILVWGQAPEVYWASDRRPATRFATTGFVTGATGGRPPDRVGGQYAVPGATADFSDDLRRHPPALIADMSTADQRHAHFYPPSRFPGFQRYLDAGGWHRVATVDGVAILRPEPAAR
jgi:Dolichyl-phosphate-mannose-protein mannosyltransferase